MKNKDSVLKFFRDLKGEFKKIVWPSKNQVINNTVIVIAAVVVIGLCISLIDLGLSFLVKLFLGTL
jgi:preprotein translocase subunit SecE